MQLTVIGERGLTHTYEGVCEFEIARQSVVGLIILWLV